MNPHTIRNIGIIAHIDAGKTTLSERLLFFTRKIHRMGEVHDGTATMDYLPEEQERGITITSACTTCEWGAHTLNLIDTPGHVDFTMEVERSLRVLDGAVGIFCAVGGVEPQSETVWRQSEQFQVPKLIFINKMDRIGADFNAVLSAVRTRLDANPVPLNIPIGAAETFSGVIDLLHERALTFDPDDQGQTVNTAPLTPGQATLAAPWREKLLESVAEQDDLFCDAYLAGTFTLDDVLAALRRATHARRLTPVLTGSALRNIGVQPLLDAVCAFLPSPPDTPFVRAHNPHTGTEHKLACDASAPFMGLAFKVLMDGGRKMTLMRLYAGTLHEGDTLANATRGSDDRVSRLMRLHADRREQIAKAFAGDIVGIIGLRSAHTGDTFASAQSSPLLESIHAYQPVISLALEPRNADESKTLDEALERFTIEDPTLLVQLDEGSGHRVLSGMGELHLDIILDRIEREYKITPRKGQPQVVRRETVRDTASADGLFDRELGKEYHYGNVTLTVSPRPRGSGNSVVSTLDPLTVPAVLREAASQGIDNALQSGPSTGYPVEDVAITITAIARKEGQTSAAGTHMAAGLAVRTALEAARLCIMEPLMFVEILVQEAHLGSAISLFSTRGGKVDNLQERGGVKVVHGTAPLSQLFGFSTALRSATQGRAGLTMRFERFDIV